jgi:hypothetical protein
MFLTEVGVAVGILLDALLGWRGLASLLRLFWCFGFLARNQDADAEKDQRQSGRCRNSRLHKCLRLPECTTTHPQCR